MPNTPVTPLGACAESTLPNCATRWPSTLERTISNPRRSSRSGVEAFARRRRCGCRYEAVEHRRRARLRSGHLRARCHEGATHSLDPVVAQEPWRLSERRPERALAQSVGRPSIGLNGEQRGEVALTAAQTHRLCRQRLELGGGPLIERISALKERDRAADKSENERNSGGDKEASRPSSTDAVATHRFLVGVSARSEEVLVELAEALESLIHRCREQCQPRTAEQFGWLPAALIP